RLAEERGASASVEYHMTRGLLEEVIYAAGGVERELGQLSTALADVQRSPVKQPPTICGPRRKIGRLGAITCQPRPCGMPPTASLTCSVGRDPQSSAPIAPTGRARRSVRDCS